VLRHLSGKVRGLRILLVWKGRARPPDGMDRRPNRKSYSCANPKEENFSQDLLRHSTQSLKEGSNDRRPSLLAVKGLSILIKGMLKKAASSVLAILPCSRTESTLRASKWLRPCLWKGASWRAWVGWVRQGTFLNIPSH